MCRGWLDINDDYEAGYGEAGYCEFVRCRPILGENVTGVEEKRENFEGARGEEIRFAKIGTAKYGDLHIPNIFLFLGRPITETTLLYYILLHY